MTKGREGGRDGEKFRLLMGRRNSFKRKASERIELRRRGDPLCDYPLLAGKPQCAGRSLSGGHCRRELFEEPPCQRKTSGG